RNFRGDAESANDPTGRVGNLRQLLRRRIDVDRRVSTEDNVLLEDQHVEATDDFGLRMRADHLEGGTDRLWIMHADAGEESIGVAAGHHHGSEIISVEQELVGFAVAQSLALATLPQVVGVLVALLRFRWIVDRYVAQRDVILGGEPLDRFALAKQNWRAHSLVDDHAGGADNFGLFAFGKYNALRIPDGAIDDPAHDPACAAETRLQLLAVALEVDHLLGDSAGDSGPGNRGRYPQQDARIEREGNEIVRSEFDRAQAV